MHACMLVPAHDEWVRMRAPLRVLALRLRRLHLPATPRRRDCILIPVAAWKIRFSGACLTTPTAVGVRRSLVSRLFGSGVCRYADSVLIAAVDRDTCEAD